MSVVICVLNGSPTISAALESLLNQSYPHNRYEIIVIDDGSTDGTSEKVAKFKRVRLIRLEKNAGIPTARNIGLDAAKGEIFVGFDDDCIAEPNWLEELAKGYVTDKPLGVGGRFVEPLPIKGIANRYISASDSSIGARVQGPGAQSKNPVSRLWRYLKARLRKEDSEPHGKVAVTELYGANGSYPVDVLKKVGGWDPAMFWIEDRDLSQRISEAFPERSFYIMPSAVVTHGGGQTLTQYLLRPYLRGPVNLAFHRKNKISPPVFPFPFLFLLLLTASGAISPYAVVLCAILIPQLLYFWWPLKSWKTKSKLTLLFPYLQLTEESMVIAGLGRGYVKLFRTKYAARLPLLDGSINLLFALTMTGIWWLAVQSSVPSWPHTVLSSLVVLVLPGINLLQLIEPSVLSKVTFRRALGYSIGLSLLLLMLTGLLLNEWFVLSGRSAPFTTRHITDAIAAVTALLVTATFARAPTSYRLWSSGWLRRRTLSFAWLAAVVTGLLLPALAVAGAISLNNGRTNALALADMAAMISLIICLAIFSKQLGRYYGWFVYNIAASILLGTSMRGWNITGHDVIQEFQVFELTLSHSAWHMQYYHDPYMACLSITILPVILQKITGMHDQYIYKFLFQLIAAMLAPVLFEIARILSNRRIALLSVLLFISFPTFLTDIMMLNRQEIALLFFALSLMVAIDPGISRRGRGMLSFLLLSGMVVSHYSTSYIAIGALLVSLGLASLWWVASLLLRKKPTAFSKLTDIYHAPVIIAASLLLILWGSFATQTATNIYSTIGNITKALSHNQASAPTPKANPATIAPLSHYVSITTRNRPLTAKDYYAPRVISQYPVTTAAETILPLSPILKSHGISQEKLSSVYTLLRSVYAYAIEGLLVTGLLLAFIFRKKKYKIPLQYLFVGLGLLSLITLQVVLPASAIDYGITRVLQESLLVLALPSVLVGIRLLGIIRVPERLSAFVIASGLLVFLAILDGLLPTLTGGYKPTLPLSNAGLYYAAYYTHDEEITAAEWLRQDTPIGSRVYSDEFLRRKYITYADIFGQPTLVPAAIPVDSYDVLSYGDLVFNQIPAYDSSGVVYYKPPVNFLSENKNEVYASSDMAIYK